MDYKHRQLVIETSKKALSSLMSSFVGYVVNNAK